MAGRHPAGNAGLPRVRRPPGRPGRTSARGQLRHRQHLTGDVLRKGHRRAGRFARYARSQGVTLLFNTGRERGHLAGVARSLRRVGYDVREICGRKPGETLSHSKQRCRAHFVAEGYTLIANVGNRSTDFTGGNYERAFRLPNYGNVLG